MAIARTTALRTLRARIWRIDVTVAVAAALVSGLLAAAWPMAAAAQLSFSGDGGAVAYSADDGSTGFVLDQSGPRPLLKFNASNEVFVLEASESPFGDTVLSRDDGTPMVTVDALGSVLLQIGGDELFMDRDGPAQPLTVPKIEAADLTAAAADASKTASDTLGHKVAIDVDVESFGGNQQALGAARHQVYVIERALLLLSHNGIDTRSVIARIMLKAGPRISANFDKKTLNLVIVPGLGYGAGFSSHLLASLMDLET